MTLLPGYRLVVAPKFHCSTDWSARIGVGTGVEDVGGKSFPRGPWRLPTPAELALLVGTADPPTLAPGALPMLEQNPSPTPTATADSLCLFRLPEHLRSAWWDLLDASAEHGGPLRGFDEFAAKVSTFLAFKGLGVPESAQMEAIVTAAGERSIRRDPDTGQPSGLGSTVAPWSAWPLPGSENVPRLHAVVNLGDEPSAVVLINLSPAGLAAALSVRVPDEPIPATVGALVERFFRECPDYPPVRVRLEPGEGCRLPVAGLILDGDPIGKDEPDVLLLISADGSASGAPTTGGSE